MMFFYRFLYVFIWPLFRLLFHPKVRGRENIPKSGAIIFAGNHKSNLDCVLLATCLWRQDFSEPWAQFPSTGASAMPPP